MELLWGCWIEAREFKYVLRFLFGFFRQSAVLFCARILLEWLV